MRQASVAMLFAAGLAVGPAAARADCKAPNPEHRRRAEIHVTDFGSICIEFLERTGEAPATVQNFLQYSEAGDYDGSFFHRLIPGFVLQGGGFRYDPVAESYQAIPTHPPIANEFHLSNLRGTVAMAKAANQPDSATDQFFFNLADNTDLDTTNGGFTVFARVVPEDLPVLDAIAALHTEFGPLAIDDPLVGNFRNLPVTSLLPRPKDGYGCLKVFPDPTPDGQPRYDLSACTSQEELDASKALTIATLDPLVPERLVTIDTVPEPAGPWLLAAGAATLALAGRRGRRLRAE